MTINILLPVFVAVGIVLIALCAIVPPLVDEL